MTKHLLFVSAVVLLTSCSGEIADEKKILPSEEFISETTIIDTLYPAIEEACTGIMDKLQICTLSDTVLELPPCTNEYFRIFDYRPTKDWASGFIVEMIPGLYGAPVHQIVVIEEYLGQYRIVNQYLGHMMELRTQFLGYSDLLIGYDDPEIGLVAIKHVWREGKYEPVDVEEINNHFVKPEMKDSINSLFLPAFSAGH